MVFEVIMPAKVSVEPAKAPMSVPPPPPPMVMVPVSVLFPESEAMRP